MAESILVVSDWVYDRAKVHRHIDPLAESATVTMICITDTEAENNVRFRTVPTFGSRYIGLCLMFIAAVREARSREYDGLASFSLFPHGCIALAVAKLYGLPVHLGIVGIDVDVHLDAPYRRITRRLMLEFDVISVPGSLFRRDLEDIGIDKRRIKILTNPIDTAEYRPVTPGNGRYDCVWIGRFAQEKDPLLFVEAVDHLRDITDGDIRTVMVGDGPLRTEVERRISSRGLETVIELPGWVDDPVEFYQRSKTYVLTSNRDALPLTLIEAMATGLACVVPAIGNVSDIVDDGDDAVVLDAVTAGSVARTLRNLLNDDARRQRIGSNAVHVRNEYSVAQAAEDWRRILTHMGIDSKEAMGSMRGAGRSTQS